MVKVAGIRIENNREGFEEMLRLLEKTSWQGDGSRRF